MADGSTLSISPLHRAELDVEAELRSVPGTTLADAQDALDSLEAVARDIVSLARCKAQMRNQGLTDYGQEPVASVAARLAEVFAEGANLKREAAGLLDAYVAEAVR